MSKCLSESLHRRLQYINVKNIVYIHYTSVIDAYIENSKKLELNFVVEHIVTTVCSATKFTIPIFPVFDMSVYNTCI